MNETTGCRGANLTQEMGLHASCMSRIFQSNSPHARPRDRRRLVDGLITSSRIPAKSIAGQNLGHDRAHNADYRTP
jgi:hypothetical protein